MQRFFKVTCLCCIFESTSAIFVWRALRNFAKADFEENVEEMVGTTREAAGGDRVRRGRDRNETGGSGSPGNETVDKTSTKAGDERDGGDRWGMYAEEGPYTIDVRHLCLASIATFCDGVLRKMLKRWWGRLEKRRMATESSGDETVTRPAVPATSWRRRLVTNEMVATGWVMYTDERELEVDEDEIAALEGQRLVAEFRCGIY